MDKYRKVIKVADTGMVIAEVYRNSDDDRCGLEFFFFPLFTLNYKCKQAHRWADRWIETCEKQETGI